MANINFVSLRQKKLSKLSQKDLRVFKIAGLVTGIFLTILALLSAYKIYLNLQLKKTEQAQQQILSQIKNQEDLERSFIVFVNKLNILSEIFQKRKNKQESIAYFSQIFGSEVTIDQIAYDDSSQIISFRVIAADVFTLDKVFELLENAVEEERFSSLSRSNLDRSGRGTYQLQITITLGDAEGTS